MIEKRTYKGVKKQNRGITLVALVITIIIIIILSTVTISTVFGDNGFIDAAKKTKEDAEDFVNTENDKMSGLLDEYANIMAEDSEIPPPDTRSEIEKARDEGTVFDTKTELKDEHGNKVQVPEGFKIAADSGITIQQGVVIEDVSASTDENVQGSQYVWIPVGRFVKDDGTSSAEIKLGRYTFSTTDGTTMEPLQYAENYTASTVIETYYTELIEYNEGNESSGLDGRNATAKDLKGFIDSVSANGGYYIGRYEASYASGATNTTEVGNYANCKAASKVSIDYSTSSMLYNSGTLWNYITQPSASKVAINTYANSKSVKSDLMNSYAWDTAIVYIQEAGHTNYANETSVNSRLSNTGVNEDDACKINDMASNAREWTTEYSNYADSVDAYPCVNRGGNFGYSDNYTSCRYINYATSSYRDFGFRLILYI